VGTQWTRKIPTGIKYYCDPVLLFARITTVPVTEIQNYSDTVPYSMNELT